MYNRTHYRRPKISSDLDNLFPQKGQMLPLLHYWLTESLPTKRSNEYRNGIE